MRNFAPKRIIPMKNSPHGACPRRSDEHPGKITTRSRAQNVAVSDSE
jgi:hypothetical protein